MARSLLGAGAMARPTSVLVSLAWLGLACGEPADGQYAPSLKASDTSGASSSGGAASTGGSGGKDSGSSDSGSGGGGSPGAGGDIGAGADGNANASGGSDAGGNGTGSNSAAGNNSAAGGASSGGAGGSGASGSDDGIPAAYKSACKDCHGLDALGVVDKGPQIRRATREMIEYLTRAGDANETLNEQGDVVGDPLEMDAFASDEVSAADLDEIVAWLQAFPPSSTGAELFADHCAFCHGADGRGGDSEYATAYHSAPFVRQDLLGFTNYVKAGHTREDGVVIEPSERRKYMPPFFAVLTDEQIELIYEWSEGQ